MPTTAPLAELVAVERNFGAIQALRSLSLEISRGEIVALLGPNGAGKTTAIDILLGLRRPDRGHAFIMGEPPEQHSVRRHVGATPQETSFPPTLKVREIVEFVRTHYPNAMEIGDVLARFDLSDLEDRLAERLSGGQRRRLAVALAFVGRPQLMFLDEPTVGLDISSRRAVWREAFAYASDGGTLLFTTHYLEEADALATRVLVIDHGQVLFSGPTASVRARLGVRRVAFAAASLPELPGIVEQELRDGRYHLLVRDSDSFVRALAASNVEFARLTVSDAPLEEAVLSLLEGGTNGN